MKRVAVILLNWNGLNDTIDCLTSLYETEGIDIVCYVVDNNSRNNEAAIIGSKYPAVRLLPQSENLGFCKGNNVGISQAIKDGLEYVLILNNDTLVPAEAIAELVAEFERLPGAGAISPVILEYPETEKVWFARAEWQSERAQFDLNPDRKNYNKLKEEKPWKSEFACGCCLLTSAEMLKETGLLDERYFAYYDEADWCKRLEKKGYSSYVTSAAFIYHKVSRTTPGLVSTYLLTRNRKLWMKENLPFSERARSFSYLTKELIWHFCNARGLVKGIYTKAHSRAFLTGWKDYHMKRFGRWNKKTEAILYPGKTNI